MSTIDEVYQRFLTIRAELPAEDEKPINEANTRFKLIDRILVEVLGWPRTCVDVELPAGGTDDKNPARLDYLLRDELGTIWFIVEAKKRREELVSGATRKYLHDGKPIYKLGGPVLKNCLSLIERQMTPYLGRYMPEYGLVTNGDQWIGFLGKARPNKVELADTQAVAFRSLDAIAEMFAEFYELFSHEGAQRRNLHGWLDPDTSRGVVRCPAPERIVPPGEERRLHYQENEAFYNDLRQAMNAAFSSVPDDMETLTQCFVESQHSREADSRLARLANHLSEGLLDAAEHYPTVMVEELENGLRAGDGYICRLVGENSAGKSVFLRRFYATQLDALKEHVALIWIDAEKLEPFDPVQASRLALEQLKACLFGEEGPEWAQLREVYRKEWKTKLRALGLLEEAAGAERADFIKARLSDEETGPGSAFDKYAAFAVRSRRILPCIVVDNMDDPDRAARAIAWAVACYRNTFSLVTVAIQDTTLWRLRGADADQLAGHSPEQFWLYRPKMGQVLARRCEYLQRVLTGDSTNGTRIRARVGRHKQLKWDVNPEHLVRVVSAVLIGDKDIANWIGQICNYAIRDALELCKRIVLSPHVKVDALLSSQVTHAVPHRRSILKAIIAPQSEQFQGQPTDVVMNVLGFWHDADWAPLLPARLLAYLVRKEDDERNRKEAFPGFVPVGRLQSLFEAHCRTPPGITLRALEKLTALKLLETYDPSHVDLEHESTQLKVTPRGRLHLEWCQRERTYLRSMAEVDLLVDKTFVQEMRAAFDTLLGAGPETPDVEQRFIARYIGHVLEHARRVSPLSGHEDMVAVQELEQTLAASVARWPAKG